MAYELQHFLLFSADVFMRLERYLQHEFLLLSVGLNLLLLVSAGYARTQTVQALMFAALTTAWAWLGWRYYIIDYATINGYSMWMGAACLIQLPAFIMVAVCAVRKGLITDYSILYLTLAYVLFIRPFLLVLLGYPLLPTPLGVLPVPTLLLSVGVLLSVSIAHRRLLLVIPVALLLLETITLYGLEDSRWQEGPVVALLLIMLAVSIRQREVRGVPSSR